MASPRRGCASTRRRAARTTSCSACSGDWNLRHRSSLIVLAMLSGCMPEYDTLLICHTANCAGTGLHEDDTLDGLTESLALRTDGRPTFDGVEVDTYLYFDGTESICLFAHDDLAPALAAAPGQAASLIADFLDQDDVSWNGERFYLKVELKPTVAGTNYFHDSEQLQQHASCALQLVADAVARSHHQVTVILDSTSECLHDELQK